MTCVIEFPTLFALIDPSGTAMALEEFVYTRKCVRYYSWEMLRLQDFLDAHDRLPEADYKACSLSGFKDVIAQALARCRMQAWVLYNQCEKRHRRSLYFSASSIRNEAG